MDLENYKETFKRGENIDFLMSKKKIVIWFFSFLGVACLCACVFLPSISSEIEGYVKILGIVAVIACVYGALRLGKFLFGKQQPQLFSVNKDSLIIYNTPVSALLSKDSACAIIPWNEILDLEIKEIEVKQASRKFPFIVLKCNYSAIQNLQAPNQPFEKMFQIYHTTNDSLFLYTKSWIDISQENILTLLKEFHKEATSQKQ